MRRISERPRSLRICIRISSDWAERSTNCDEELIARDGVLGVEDEFACSLLVMSVMFARLYISRQCYTRQVVSGLCKGSAVHRRYDGRMGELGGKGEGKPRGDVLFRLCRTNTHEREISNQTNGRSFWMSDVKNVYTDLNLARGTWAQPRHRLSRPNEAPE